MRTMHQRQPIERYDFDLANLLTSIRERAAEADAFGAFPSKDVAELEFCGLLAAPLPVALGGCGWADDPSKLHELFNILVDIGAANLSLGRLYEGHVNAIKLVIAYGNCAQQIAFADEVHAGHMSGVWNADGDDGAIVADTNDQFVTLAGRKIWSSGAGHISRPIVTARSGSNAVMILLDDVDADRADCSAWQPTGMRATATGTFDLTAKRISSNRVIGSPGDYLRHPVFAGGAWRYLAVQAGAVRGLATAAAEHLRQRDRVGDTAQQLRFGTVAIHVEAALMWAQQAAQLAETGTLSETKLKIAIWKARLAIERHALDVMELVTRGIGLNGLIVPSPIERMLRDLGTYLRQPGPDHHQQSVGTDFLLSAS